MRFTLSNHRASLDAGVAFCYVSGVFGPAWLRWSLDHGETRDEKMKIIGASRSGCEVLLGLVAVVGVLSGLVFFLNDCRWNDPVLLLIIGSALGVVFCLSRIFGWSVLLGYTREAATRITGSIFTVLAVAAPLAGSLVGALYSHRRHGWESAEQSLVHFFEYAGILALGMAAGVMLAAIAFFRRERDRWLAVFGVILVWPLIPLLRYVFFW
jgi:hypothetical protein